MTLDRSKTADDEALIQALIPYMQNKLWYDHTKRHWHLKTDNQWHKENLVTIQTFLTHLGNQLPDTPYWARSKHRLSWFASQQPILSHIRHLCRRGLLTPPPVSDLP